MNVELKREGDSLGCLYMSWFYNRDIDIKSKSYWKVTNLQVQERMTSIGFPYLSLCYNLFYNLEANLVINLNHTITITYHHTVMPTIIIQIHF